MLARLHLEAADELNRADGVKGRRVSNQFWDKTLTFEGSWLVRLRYTHENAVHHGLVTTAMQYPWCSAAWFERTAPRKFVDIVHGLTMDSNKTYDDSEPTRAVALPPHS
jgi:putative transposase